MFSLRRGIGLFALLAAAVSVSVSAQVWTGAGGDLLWANGLNWQGGVAPSVSGDVTFATSFTSGTAIDLTPGQTVNSLTLAHSKAFSLTGGVLTVTGGNITRDAGSAGAATLAGGVTFGGPANIVNNGGNKLVMSGPVTLAGLTAIGGGYNTQITGAITGTGGITKSGNGIVTLDNVGNAYTGVTTVNSGILAIGSKAALGATGVDNETIVNNGGTIMLYSSANLTYDTPGPELVTINGNGHNGMGAIYQFGMLTYQNIARTNNLNWNINVASDSLVNVYGMVANNSQLTFSGALSGSGKLTKAGQGQLTLSGNNVTGGFSGKVDVLDGKLIFSGINAMGAIPAGGIYIADKASVANNFTTQADWNTFISKIDNTSKGAISLNGAVSTDITIDMSGLNADMRLSWNGNCSFAGSITPFGDTYRLGGAASTGATLTLTKANALSGDRNLDIGQNREALFISQPVGRVTLTNSNNYTGWTRVRGDLYADGTVNPAFLTLEGNGALTATSSIEVYQAASLVLDDKAILTSVNRINDNTRIILNSAYSQHVYRGLMFLGSNAANTSETVGTLEVGNGYSSVYVRNGRVGTTSTPTTFTYDATFASLERSGKGVVGVHNPNGNLAGIGGGAGKTRILFTTAPTMIGGGGAAGTTTQSIIPFMFGQPTLNNDATNNTLMTYDATNGLRPLENSEYATSIGGATETQNVRVGTAESNFGTKRINALVTTAAVAFGAATDVLQLTSGVILASSGNPTFNCAVDFGSAEGVIAGNASVTFNGPLSGSNGVTFARPTYLKSLTSNYTGTTAMASNVVYVYGNGAIPASSNLQMSGGALTLGGAIGVTMTLPNNVVLTEDYDRTGYWSDFATFDAASGVMTLTGNIQQSGYTLHMNSTNRHGVVVYAPTTPRTMAGETGKTMVAGGGFAISDMANLSSGNLHLNGRGPRQAEAVSGGTMILSGETGHGVPTVAQFKANRSGGYGTGAYQWQMAGGGFAARGKDVRLTAADVPPSAFDQNFTIGATGLYTIDLAGNAADDLNKPRLYADASMEYAFPITMTDLRHVYIAPTGPGLMWRSGTYPVQKITGGISGNGAPSFHGTTIGGRSALVSELVLGGTNNWTGSSIATALSGEGQVNYGTTGAGANLLHHPWISSGPGGMYLGYAGLTTAGQTGGLLRFADDASFPTGNAGAPAYLIANAGSGNTPSFNGTGYLVTAKAEGATYDLPSGMKFVIGTPALFAHSAGLYLPSPGIFGSATDTGDTTAVATVRDTVIAITKNAHTFDGNGLTGATVIKDFGLNLLVREGTLVLGQANKPVVFQATSLQHNDASAPGTLLPYDAEASPLVDDADQRLMVKRGSGTLVLENIAYQKLDGTSNASQYVWAIGKGAYHNGPNRAKKTYAVTDDHAWNDGAVRTLADNNPAADNSNSLANFYVGLAGGVIEVDGKGNPSLFNRALGNDATNPDQVGWVFMDTNRTSANYGRFTIARGGGGFSAYNGDLVVQLNGNTAEVIWDSTPYFVNVDNPLMFGSQTANSTVDFQNGIGTKGGVREFRVFRGVGSAPEVQFSNAITGTGGVLKTEQGTMRMAANNTYTGATEVYQGTLLVNGISPANQGAFTVRNAARLGGLGQVKANVTVDAGGILSPGDGTTVGTLTLGNNHAITVNAGSKIEIDIAGTTSYDKLAILGTGTINDTQLVTRMAGRIFNPDVINVLVNDGTDTVGNFVGVAEGTKIYLGKYTEGAQQIPYWAQVTYAADAESGVLTGGNDIALYNITGIMGDANLDGACDFADYLVLESNFGSAGTWAQADFTQDGVVDFADYLILESSYGSTGAAVPEPMTLSLLGLGALALLRRRK